MKDKTIIYYRKSTDRDDKQANSLQHQLNNCRRTAENHNLQIQKEIEESKSAKTEFTREWFNELIKLCKTWKIAYIIIDEPKRLSRNNIDTSRIIDLLDKKQIKWILATSREYRSDNSRDKFLLQLDLSLSKMDNEDRSKDVKDKMITAFKRGQWVWKAPIWYKNITIKKGHKDIIIDEDIAPFIKKAFELRISWYSFTKIQDYLFDSWVKSSVWTKIWLEQVRKILSNSFYMWIMKWGWLEVKGNHKPLITKLEYLKANNIKKPVVHTYKNRVYRLAWIIKDESKMSMCWYTKKWHIYYHQWKNSNHTINISEKLVFSKFWELLEYFKLDSWLKEITTSMLRDIYDKAIEKTEIESNAIKSKIKHLESRKESLVDSFLDRDIEKDLYKKKMLDIELEIEELSKKLQPTSKVNTKKLQKIKYGSELFVNLYSSYSKIKIEEKVNILKSLRSELLVSTKKELQLAENRLLELLKKVCFHIWYSQGELNPCLNRERVPS